jgi:hypothetical protein
MAAERRYCACASTQSNLRTSFVAASQAISTKAAKRRMQQRRGAEHREIFRHAAAL